MPANNTSSVYEPAVIDMVTVAAEYCLFLEQLNAKGVTREDFLQKVTKLLPLIYVKGAVLPAQEEQGLDDVPEIVTESDYEEVRQAVWRLLRSDDEYLEVFTPDMQYCEGAVNATISEDLADIYQDLKNFVAVFADRNEITMSDAITKLRENFSLYWGQRLVNAMRPLHELTYGSKSDNV